MMVIKKKTQESLKIKKQKPKTSLKTLKSLVSQRKLTPKRAMVKAAKKISTSFKKVSLKASSKTKTPKLKTSFVAIPSSQAIKSYVKSKLKQNHPLLKSANSASLNDDLSQTKLDAKFKKQSQGSPSSVNSTVKTAASSGKSSHALKEEFSLKPFVDVNTDELPSSYDKTWVTLMVKDPFWLFANWEVGPSDFSYWKESLLAHGSIDPKAKLILRMYDVTLIDMNQQPPVNSFDIEVGTQTNNWYINLWKDNVSYCADLGVLKSTGEFVALARSNVAHTPSANYSWRTEQIWVEVKEETPQTPFVELPVSLDSMKKQQVAQSFYKRGWRFSITDDDIRRYYSRLMPYLYKVLKEKLSSKPSKWNRLKAMLYRSHDLSLRRGVYTLLPKGKFLKKLLVGASEQMEWEEEEFGFAGSSETISSFSSHVLGVKDHKARKFFFELDCHLTVYGRTEPDATVTLGDQEIPLKSDGTFSCYFALPDGTIPMEFTAHSSDGIENRTIAPTVVRQTRYDAPVFLKGKVG